MDRIQRFFLFCSGVHPSILSRTPTELNKYLGIGATVFFTGLFAAVAGGYALYTVFSSVIIASVFGLLWGLMIFNLDRYIVSTMKKKSSFFKDLYSATPRIVLALLIAIVIAKPLELKIFESEILSELSIMEEELQIKQEKLIRGRFMPEIEAAQTTIDVINREIESATLKRDNLALMALQEADGTGGSGIKNLGPIYEAKKADANRAQAELDNLLIVNSPEIHRNREIIVNAEQAMANALITNEEVRLTGLAARIEALERISRRSEAIFYAGLFIMLLFIALETAPVFVKLIASRGPYDYVLDRHEQQFALNHMLITGSLNNAASNELEFRIATNNRKTELATKAELELAESAVRDHVERLKKKPMLWRALLRKGKLYGLE